MEERRMKAMNEESRHSEFCIINSALNNSLLKSWTNPTVSAGSRTKFLEKEKDAESGDCNLGVRQYGDGVGRFFCPDKMWEKYYSLSPYVYCGNNPVGASDPSGLDFGFYVDKDKAGRNGHTSLYFQKDGIWYKYDQFAEGNPNTSGLVFSANSVKGGVSIEPVNVAPPEGTVIYQTTPEQDKQVSDCADQSQVDHANGTKLYNLYSNNCTDAAVDVINCALPNLQIPNPASTVKPNTWIKELKENTEKQKELLKAADNTLKSSDPSLTPSTGTGELVK
ncbi:MAG: hypothetical protein NT007_02830 [Candidatus Kapabacteria bacterium]|nr:hypothetical protein [Candidatus Kapabacteria bacterium]